MAWHEEFEKAQHANTLTSHNPVIVPKLLATELFIPSQLRKGTSTFNKRLWCVPMLQWQNKRTGSESNTCFVNASLLPSTSAAYTVGDIRLTMTQCLVRLSRLSLKLQSMQLQSRLMLRSNIWTQRTRLFPISSWIWSFLAMCRA